MISESSISSNTLTLQFSANSGIHSKEGSLSRLEHLVLEPLPLLSLGHSILPTAPSSRLPAFSSQSEASRALFSCRSQDAWWKIWGRIKSTTYLSTAVGITLVKEGAPGVAFDRSVNRESNAFMGSILDGVVNTEGDIAAGVEVAFILRNKNERFIKHKRQRI